MGVRLTNHTNEIRADHAIGSVQRGSCCTLNRLLPSASLPATACWREADWQATCDIRLGRLYLVHSWHVRVPHRPGLGW